VDVARQKEAILKVRIQLWIDEAFRITAYIKGKLTQMNVMHALREGPTPDSENSPERVEQNDKTMCCGPSRSTGTVGGAPCQHHYTSRVTWDES